MATIAEQLASFVSRVSPEDISNGEREQMKIRVLDSLGCALGALGAPPIEMIGRHTAEFGQSGRCSLIGGGHAAPDRAAFFNGALVRYLDFNDSFLAPGETCHPSDNLAAVLAASEDAGRNGEDFLTALGVAYQVQCRLSEAAPVRAKGFDHTTQGSYAVAAGVSKALGLSQSQTAHALAMAGTALNALRVTRTGSLSHWKGLAYPYMSSGATQAAYLARQGITGPPEVFEGNKGFMDAISGKFAIDWEHETLEMVARTIVKKFNAEIHSQSAIEGMLDLKSERSFDPEDVKAIEVEIFDVAYHIIGGGDEGDKTMVETKEQADHSLPYLLAVAILDGQVMPGQFESGRIRRPDAQTLLRKINVRPSDNFSRGFPREMPCRITVRLNDGTELSREKRDYEGFHTRPMTWHAVTEKFTRLTEYLPAALRDEIIGAVANLEGLYINELMNLLRRARMDSAAALAA
ncbi:MAG TPA: MmgE/PrpD family protein [Candidatus Sulfotelmatobacter sp.]|nr:MmgE/PrpD family protein [Candidatus Sulfotelmatobacter sp.]